jgi:hypothetical protein
MERIAANVARLREEVFEAAIASGRRPEEIRILAATKNRNASEILAAVSAGIDLVGENTVQEALKKFEFLPEGVERHMIGHLQLNKVKPAVKLFDMIQSVDSFELASKINLYALTLKKKMPILIEVNPSGEGSKYGVALEDVLPLVDKIKDLAGVSLQGLMAMLPYEDPQKLRPYFKKMRRLADVLKKEGIETRWLSMGISNDFRVAIEEGSNLIRIGTKIFGRF